MVRTSRPLVERMALVWHDWFATSNSGVGSQRLMLNQNQLFRDHGLGSFTKLLLDVTQDPAMLLWLNGSDNSRWSPNENYAREMMELFTLGAGRGYTETDVREQARALTGFRNDWRKGVGDVNFRYDPKCARPGHEDDLQAPRRVHVEGLRAARRVEPESSELLRPQAVELLHPRHAGQGHRARARAPLRLERVRRQARRHGDPRAPGALRPAGG